jgi:hypothetical protein
MPHGYATILESSIVPEGADSKTDRVRTGCSPWIRIELKSFQAGIGKCLDLIAVANCVAPLYKLTKP